MLNSSHIFLGEQIKVALNVDRTNNLLESVPIERRDYLKAQYAARLNSNVCEHQFTFLFFNPSKASEAWLGTCPSPGYYQSKFELKSGKGVNSDNPGFEGVAVVPSVEGQTSEVVTQQGEGSEGQSRARGQGEGKVRAKKGNSEGNSRAGQGQVPSSAHCPKCGHVSTSLKSKKLSSTGRVSFRCTNSECRAKTFSVKVQ